MHIPRVGFGGRTERDDPVGCDACFALRKPEVIMLRPIHGVAHGNLFPVGTGCFFITKEEIIMEINQEAVQPKKRIFSGIQPTGVLTLGNYLGALRNFSLLQDEYDCVYSVVDLHAITVRQNPADLRKNCLNVMSLYLATGLDPKKNIIFFQSHVHEHAELGWILDCYTYMGELQRMTQFKDKSAKHADNINCGLFAYPTLMAADILLYQTDLVPIGADQKQHLELSRDIAQRFNALYPDTFVVPDGYFPKVGARIMSLQEPTRKMSKSDPEETYISLLDPKDVIRKKFRRAVTDSDNRIAFDAENKPGVTNLMSILSTLTGKTMDEIVAEYDGKGYGVFKDAVADVVIENLEPIQAEYARIRADKAYLEEIMTDGAERASHIAHKTMLKVRKKVGLAALKL